jgi:hypothetical protein
VDRQLKAHAGENWTLTTKNGRRLTLDEIWDDDDYILKTEAAATEENEPHMDHLSTEEVKKGNMITVYWGLGVQKLEYTGDQNDFKDRVRAHYKIPGNFELKTGKDDAEHDFEFKKGEDCHVVEITNGGPIVSEWVPPTEDTMQDEPPPAPAEEVATPAEAPVDPNVTLVSSVDPEDLTETTMEIPPTPEGPRLPTGGSRMISGTPGHAAHLTGCGDSWIDLDLIPIIMEGLRSHAEKGTIQIHHQGHQWMGEEIQEMDLIEAKGKLRAGGKNHRGGEGKTRRKNQHRLFPMDSIHWISTTSSTHQTGDWGWRRNGQNKINAKRNQDNWFQRNSPPPSRAPTTICTGRNT